MEETTTNNHREVKVQTSTEKGKFDIITSEELAEQETATWRFWTRRRYLVAVLGFFGFFNVYALRVNLSIAVVAMTENRTLVSPNGTTVYYGPEFDWDSQMKGLILSSFFYGYIVTQLPGGWLANRYGGNKVFAIGIGMTALLTLLTPLLAKMSTPLLITVRIIEGLFEGVTFPCIHAVWARWAPPLERSRLATIAFSGSFVGTVVSMPLSGVLAAKFGWPSIFYVFGTIGLIWFAVWWWIVKGGPELDPKISPAELKYIQDSLGRSSFDSKTIKYPWKSFLTSPPVWAIIASHFSENWGFYTLLTLLPTFMRDRYGFQLSSTGILSALPYLAMAIVIQVAGHLADIFQKKRIFTTTQVRKLFNCSAFLAQTIFMLSASFAPNAVSCEIFLIIAVGLGGFAWSGFMVNHLDIAPQYASILMGISNTVATLPGIVSPLIAGVIVQHAQIEEWRIVFFISSGIYLFGCIIYGIFCSGERQPWAMDEHSDPAQNDADQYSTGKPVKGDHCYTNNGVDLTEQDEN